jgi:hypothetical protein
VPIAVTCAGCRTDYTLPDAMRGMSFTCDCCRASVAVDESLGASAAMKQGEPAEYPAASPFTAHLPSPEYEPPVRMPDVRLPPRRLATFLVLLTVFFGGAMLTCTGLGVILDPLAYYRKPPGRIAPATAQAWPATMAIPLPAPDELPKRAEPELLKPPGAVEAPAAPGKNVR